MRDLIRSWPVKSTAVRRELVGTMNCCPECSNPLDTGYECTVCEFDAISLVPVRYKRPEPVSEDAEQ